jgi:hypothetical protein
MKIKNCPVVNVVRLHEVYHGIQSSSVVLSLNLCFYSSQVDHEVIGSLHVHCYQCSEGLWIVGISLEIKKLK